MNVEKKTSNWKYDTWMQKKVCYPVVFFSSLTSPESEVTLPMEVHPASWVVFFSAGTIPVQPASELPRGKAIWKTCWKTWYISTVDRSANGQPWAIVEYIFDREKNSLNFCYMVQNGWVSKLHSLSTVNWDWVRFTEYWNPSQRFGSSLEVCLDLICKQLQVELFSKMMCGVTLE